MVRLAEYISRAAAYAVSVIVMVFSPISVIVVSPFTTTGVVMFLLSQVTLPEMVSSVLAAAWAERAAGAGSSSGSDAASASPSCCIEAVSSSLCDSAAHAPVGRRLRHKVRARNRLNIRFFIRSPPYKNVAQEGSAPGGVPPGARGFPLANGFSLNRRGELTRPANDPSITLRPKRFSASAPSAPGCRAHRGRTSRRRCHW